MVVKPLLILLVVYFSAVAAEKEDSGNPHPNKDFQGRGYTSECVKLMELVNEAGENKSKTSVETGDLVNIVQLIKIVRLGKGSKKKTSLQAQQLGQIKTLPDDFFSCENCKYSETGEPSEQSEPSGCIISNNNSKIVTANTW